MDSSHSDTVSKQLTWHVTFYLQEMKAMLYAAVEQAPSAELVEPEVLTRYFAKFDEQFFHYCDKELAKINTFYSGMLTK